MTASASASNSSATRLGRLCYKRLLGAARGRLSTKGRKLRCFALQSHHLQADGDTFMMNRTPREFHASLCESIRTAQKRVHLASLYVGAAAAAEPGEAELLEALQQSTASVRILLDRNRALRPVSIKRNAIDNKSSPITTSSAQACQDALDKRRRDGSSSEIYLLSVLPTWAQAVLPNPLNEVAGVFHLKVYIVDDNLILSGANLSEEYFVDRVDRYLWIRRGGNGLVDCYAELLRVLCEFGAQKYITSSSSLETTTAATHPTRHSSTKLIQEISRVLTVPNDDHMEHEDVSLGQQPQSDISDVVAYAVPTFQAPFLVGVNFPSDVQVVENLLQAAATKSTSSCPTNKNDDHTVATLRLASAYLNPTDRLQSIMAQFRYQYWLTAGRVSHGFAPRKSGKNKSRAWIPTVYETLLRGKPTNGNNVWLYKRPGWTFHAKGLWITTSSTHNINNKNDNDDDNSSKVCIHSDPQQETLVAATVGSGNYGGRSAWRDWESNLVLVFPQRSSPLQVALCAEWNRWCRHATARREDEEEKRSLPWHVRMALPWLRSFF